MCRSSGGNASARDVEVEPAEPEEEREIQHVRALSVCDNSYLPSDDSGNLLNMIMDSGAEEHEVFLKTNDTDNADWKSVGLKPAQVRLRSATGDDMGVSGRFCDAWMVR